MQPVNKCRTLIVRIGVGQLDLAGEKGPQPIAIGTIRNLQIDHVRASCQFSPFRYVGSQKLPLHR